MVERFDEKRPHQENVKIAVDKVLGKATTLKRVKKSDDDRKRALFSKILNKLVSVEERSVQINEVYDIDNSKYDNAFFDIIEDLFSMLFTKEQRNLIEFYLYERYLPNGTVVDLTNERGEIVKLDTPEDLWELLKTIKNEPTT